MQQIITAKLKLLTTPEQQQALRQTQLAYRDALNFVSEYAFEPRRLRAMSGRERRFKLNVNHVIATTIIQENPHTLIGLEDLTNIRERTKRRKRRRKGKKTLPLTSKQRRANHHASKWAFAELHHTLMYKAALAGSKAIKVDANYTSQACPMCGYIDKKNRPGKGLLFICQNMHCTYRLHTGRPYTLHADLVGARNVAMRTFLIRQDWVRTGILSICPDVSDDKAKAERLKRYSELRWSPVQAHLLGV
jgi:IS605 OrfB family transposase